VISPWPQISPAHSCLFCCNQPRPSGFCSGLDLDHLSKTSWTSWLCQGTVEGHHSQEESGGSSLCLCSLLGLFVLSFYLLGQLSHKTETLPDLHPAGDKLHT
jgi:hypothetical protein